MKTGGGFEESPRFDMVEHNEPRCGEVGTRNNTGSWKTRRLWPWLTLVCVAAIALVVFAGRSLGPLVSRADPLERGDAIKVLSGGMPERAIEAAHIYRQGFALQVWLTHSTEPGATLREHGVNYTGEDTYDKLLLIHEGVRESEIHVLDSPFVYTADEINVAGRALRKSRWQAKNHHCDFLRTRGEHAPCGDGWLVAKELPSRGVTDDSFDSGIGGVKALPTHLVSSAKC